MIANVSNRLGGYGYDTAGDMLNDGFHQYAYDGENRITTVDSTAAVYTYGPDGNRVRKDSGGVGTKYISFNGSVIAEKDVTTGNWSDYIFAGGKRIARANNFEHQLHISGQECANCGWQWYQFNFTNLGGLAGRTIQSGDTLRWTQWNNTGSKGGIIITYTDGTDSCCSSAPLIADQNGELILRGNLSQNLWEYRIANLSPVAGKTISQIRLYADGQTTPGQWDIYFQDLVFTGADGTVVPLFSQNATVPGLSGFGSTGMTQTSATINNCVGSGCAPINTTTYYHGDQIGSSRLLTNGTGYPIWQGTFLPFGEEYNAQITTNHYKFTDKERDNESGLDYFGARYYSSSLGRWTSSDAMLMSAKHLLAPQRWNRYAYVRNNPLSMIDPDGFDDFYVFRPEFSTNGTAWDKIQADAKAHGNNVKMFNGKDATTESYNNALSTKGAHVVDSGHTVETIKDSKIIAGSVHLSALDDAAAAYTDTLVTGGTLDAATNAATKALPPNNNVWVDENDHSKGMKNAQDGDKADTTSKEKK